MIALVHFNHTTADNLTSWPDMRTSKWKPNYGDMLVCAAIIRQLPEATQNPVRVGFGGQLSRKVDRAIVRGSTYLHKDFDFEAANKTLDSIDAPLAIVGLGAQSPNSDPTFVDDIPGAKDFVARLSEKSKSISVRGAFTADVVERLGGKNIRITGCPSLFYTLSQQPVRVPEMLRLPERSVGVSLHTGLMRNIFCSAPVKARQKQADAMIWALKNTANTAFFEQGVKLEYDIADRSLPFQERLSAAQTVLKRLGNTEGLTKEKMLAHMVSVQNIEEWLAKARDLDAIIGFRFHGNMIALLQGKPCYYWVYDSRLTEFCELYGLPYQHVRKPWRDPAQAMIRHDWEAANKRQAACLTELKSFYEENGFETNL